LSIIIIFIINIVMNTIKTLFNNLFKQQTKYVNIKPNINYSYGNYIRDNPKSSKNDRIKAIKLFLDNTR
jgi:hypothetical protein